MTATTIMLDGRGCPGRTFSRMARLPQIRFDEWDDSPRTRRTAAGLGRDEVRVWLAAIPPGEDALAGWLPLLSPEERRRAERFSVSEPRRQFVFGRVCLRQMLGACLGLNPAALALNLQPHGKPCLARPGGGGPDVRFNLSHSGRRLAMVLARGRDVGVDVERIHPLKDEALLAGRIFSPREQAEWRSLPEAQQRTAFFNGWTRKEAWLKATGEGLIDDLAAIEVTLAPGKEAAWLALPGGPQVRREWAVRALPLPPDYAGAVVVKR